MIFTNGRVVLPDGVREDLEVEVAGERIVALSRRGSARPGETIHDLAGDFLVPGFIDLHLHGGAGRDTMEAVPEAFRAICDFHAAGGTTSLLLTTASAPLPTIRQTVAAVRAARTALPQVAGVHLEGPFLSPRKPGAQRLDCFLEPTPALVEEILEDADLLRIVTLAPELPGALEAIREMTRRGVRVSGGHSDASASVVAQAWEAGLRQTTHTFNCMSTTHRRGIYREGGLLEFALGEPGLVCEVIADGHHVRPELLRVLYRAKGPDHICLITDATAGAGLAQGSAFSLAGRDCVVDDGVCKLADGSALAGSAARMIDCVRTMKEATEAPLEEIVRMASTNPARVLGLEAEKGRIAVGLQADLVVLDPALEVKRTYLAGALLSTGR